MTIDSEYLWQKYVVEQLSLREIAIQAGVSCSTIRYYMSRYAIPRRTKSEALSGKRNPMYGRPKSEEARRKTSKTLQQTNQDPTVRARRSLASSGEHNPMFGRTHTEEVKEASRERLKSKRTSPDFIQAHAAAMQRPEVRKAISDKARLRQGEANPFFGHVHSEETKKKISNANRGRFRGSNGSNWQGGKTPLALLIRNSERYVAWRRSVFDRDKFTCQGCRRVGGPLHADHIKPFAVLLNEHAIRTLEDAYDCADLWDISNGRTLCVPCHKRTPSFAGNYQKNYKP